MKKNILVVLLCISVLKGYSQCADCHDGRNYGHTHANTPNGNTTLGVSFDSTLCGLNYVQAVQNTQTRFAPTIGTGFPTHDTVTGLPPIIGCTRIVKAYLYCEASCKVSNPATYTIMDTVTNPLAVTNVFAPVLVGVSGTKCWGESSTATWRADVTSAITGNGPYRVNFSGFIDEDWEIDGISMVIIYQDNSASYTGTFVLSDGEYTIGGGTETYTATGFHACAASSDAVAFTDLADLQHGAEPNFTVTENATSGTFLPLFFQSALVNTTVTNGQNTSTTTLSVPGDCYAMFMYGLYFQTACLTCTPSASITYTTQITPALCGNDSGTAKIIVSSDTAGVTYHWSTGSTIDSIFNLAPGTYTATITGPGGCPIDTSSLTITAGAGLTAVIKYSKDSVCPGTADTLTLSGSGGATYKWSPGGNTDSTIHINLTSTKTYTLYVFGRGCEDSAFINLKLIPSTTASISALNDTVCPHGATTITATGIGDQTTYKWNTGATTSSISVNDTVTTTYTVTVYGVCDSVKEMNTVTVIPLPKLFINGALWKCKGSKDTLEISSSVNPTTYLWSNGRTSSSYYTGAIDADSTIYVTAENSLGCSVTDTFHIAVRQYPSATLKYSAECGTVPDTIKAVPFGTGPFTYQWSTGGTYDTINVTVPDTTTFTVVISNGCPITKTVTIIPYFPSISACCNATINIGNDTVLSASGADIVKYQWIPSTGLNCDTCANVIATPTVTTTYTVIGTDAEGCPSSRIITINVEVPCFVDSIPNVFTPSNAGPKDENNMFYITTQNLTSWSILVYDRWGKEIFKTTNPKNYWDGNTESGGPAPAGVYYYIINATCPASNYKKQGYIQLIR